MTPGLSISVSGLADAANRLATSAARISRAPAADQRHFRSAAPVAEPAAGPAKTADLSFQPLPTADHLYTPSYAEDLIAMRLAVDAYKANAKMISTYKDMDAALHSAAFRQ